MNAKDNKQVRFEEKHDKIKERKKLKRQRKKQRKKDQAMWLKLHGKNEHHILPKSLGGGRHNNISFVDIEKHQDYHKLFDNLSPDKIVNYLIDYFWNGQTKWVFEAIANREDTP